MKSKQTPFRVVGQRSIVSSLLNNSSSNPVPKEDFQKEDSGKGSRISLSDFLQRKLNDDSGFLGTIKGKSKPFSSLLGLKDGSLDEKIGNPNVVEKVVLEQFKHKETVNKEDLVCSSSNGSNGEVENTAAVPESRKRKSFEGRNDKQITRRPVVVLGANSKSKQLRRHKYNRNEDQVPTYNHYANGGGWWDSNMEGVDNEEVGFSEVWEGVGSTTFGGSLDWH